MRACGWISWNNTNKMSWSPTSAISATTSPSLQNNTPLCGSFVKPQTPLLLSLVTMVAAWQQSLQNCDFSPGLVWFGFFSCWNLSPCIGRHKIHDFNTDQKVPLKQDVLGSIAGLVIKQRPIAEWTDLQLKGKGAERSLFVSSVEASPCKGHPHHHRRLQGV